MAEQSSRLTIYDDREESGVPFLRGILTRSLQDAGLSFEEAYDVASKVRQELSEQDEITTDGLKQLVGVVLGRHYDEDVRDHYLTPRNERVRIHVSCGDGEVTPFSKTTLVQSIQICAAPADELYAVAAAVERRIATRGTAEISAREIKQLTREVLAEVLGKQSATRYLTWLEFLASGTPLIILVGGITGSGKSTVSSLLAHRLGIIRTQSTDMLREVMRQLVPRRLIPPLHESSFLAHRAMPRWESADGNLETPHMVDGYLTQAGEVRLGIEAVLHRAVREQVSIVLEGVHVHPALQTELRGWEGAVIVPVLLATLKKKTLKRQLRGRAAVVSTRRAARYLDHIDEIWALQQFLLSEADQNEVTIIAQNDAEKTVQAVMREVAVRLSLEVASGSSATLGRRALEEDSFQREEEERRKSGSDGEPDDPGQDDLPDSPVQCGDSSQ